MSDKQLLSSQFAVVLPLPQKSGQLIDASLLVKIFFYHHCLLEGKSSLQTSSAWCVIFFMLLTAVHVINYNASVPSTKTETA